MPSERPQDTSVDEYIGAFPHDVAELLQKIRATIRKAAPEAEETICYRMPTFTLNGPLVHFAACKNHLGFYPTPSGINRFRRELSAYRTTKGAVQFPLDKPLPLSLIRRIVQFRVKENREKEAMRVGRKKGARRGLTT